MTILDDFWDEYREMLPNAIFSHYGNSIPPPIGDKVAETSPKVPPTSPKYSPKPVKSP